ncbi:ABC transporter permease [Haloplasma contractile]|uniref:Oligopeptide ABC transporter permease protein n=1 Tax=Haloplasma contractile SSD-17B TaxID=1033810 RepID=U2FK90_9MOLU|nr:ABC transporter permease [Haloplasma contractile]ERJ11649.1 Oligopeptide ABC transporter permease protein [Haloplasma contractile SSD-17B]
MTKNNYEFVDNSEKQDKEQIRRSLTYWQDVWRRLKKNKPSIVGMITIILILLFTIIGPMVVKHSYKDQNNNYYNIPPRLEIYHVKDDLYVYLSKMYNLVMVSEDGELLGVMKNGDAIKDNVNKVYTYQLFDENDEVIEEVTIDFSYKTDPSKKDEGIDYSVIYNGVENKTPYKTVWNKTYILGTDELGRDVLSRLMYGMGISLLIAVIAAVINVIIGVLYGSIAGYAGGRIDNIMMRIVDIINSIPLLLYVILLMQVLKGSWFEKTILHGLGLEGGLGTIIIALVSVYWVRMARLVRGQILSLREQEYVLAAKTIGVSNWKIIIKHLIPNTLGPIIVTLTMMIPTAVFTEAFLSFIGIGISAPRASLGTLARTGADMMQNYPYQLLIPSIAIAIMMLAFNLFGDGLRDALDPKLRKG